MSFFYLFRSSFIGSILGDSGGFWIAAYDFYWSFASFLPSWSFPSFLTGWSFPCYPDGGGGYLPAGAGVDAAAAFFWKYECRLRHALREISGQFGMAKM